MVLARYFLVLFVVFSVSVSQAEENPQSVLQKTNLTKNQETTIVGALRFINTAWANPAILDHSEEYKKYFDPNITLITNGKKVYTGYDSFIRHLQQIGDHLKGQIRFPLIAVVAANNTLVVRYDLDVEDDEGRSYRMNDSAFFTLSDGRISTWSEVVYSDYFCEHPSQEHIYAK